VQSLIVEKDETHLRQWIPITPENDLVMGGVEHRNAFEAALCDARRRVLSFDVWSTTMCALLLDRHTRSNAIIPAEVATVAARTTPVVICGDPFRPGDRRLGIINNNREQRRTHRKARGNPPDCAGSKAGFATGDGGPNAMAANTIRLADAGCKIIVDDLTYPNESPFQDGVIAQAVNAVSNRGVLYSSSTANSGNQISNQSGT
jgi:hypothetical protein